MAMSPLIFAAMMASSPAMDEAPMLDEEDPPAGDPVVMSIDNAPKYKEINDKRHPDYVRCRLLPVAGARLRNQRVCMKNREWRVYLAEKNRRTRGLGEGHGSSSGYDQSKPIITDSSSH